jgi:hypothetical protein
VWKELRDRDAQVKAIAEKAEKEAARAKRRVGTKDTENKENTAPNTDYPRKASAKTALGIALLDNKAIRNPNQRGRMTRKPIQWQQPLEPITAGETAGQPPIANPQQLAPQPTNDIAQRQGISQVQEQHINQNQEQGPVGQDQNNVAPEPQKDKAKKKEKKKQATFQRLKKKMGLGPSSYAH